MFKDTTNKAELQKIVESMSDLDAARFLYCQEIAGTYLAISLFERTLISAMLMCDKVKFQKKLASDQSAWERLLENKGHLEGSTLGSLIKILERHKIDSASIAYLKWIKDKRDYFIHRLFHNHLWPGDLDEEECRVLRRRLLAIQAWMERGERNIWSIFEKANLLELDRLSNGSILAVNTGLLNTIQSDVDNDGNN